MKIPNNIPDRGKLIKLNKDYLSHIVIFSFLCIITIFAILNIPTFYEFPYVDAPEIKQFRYRLESRVRAFIFISILVYRLLNAIRWMINSSESSNMALSTSEFLKKLSRVHKLEVDLGKEIERFFVNLTTDISKQLIALGMKNLLSGRRFLKT